MTPKIAEWLLAEGFNRGAQCVLDQMWLAVLAVPLQSILRRYPQCLSVLDDTPQTLSVAAAICISLSQRSLRTMTVDQDLVHEAVVELLA